MLEEVGARVHGDVHGDQRDEFGGEAPLMLFGTDAQKKKYLRRMATGETLGAFLPDGAGGGFGRSGDTSTSNMRRKVYK